MALIQITNNRGGGRDDSNMLPPELGSRVFAPGESVIMNTTEEQLLAAFGLSALPFPSTWQFKVTTQAANYFPPGHTSRSSVTVVETSSDLTLSAEQTIDGTLTSADRVLLTAQSPASENGLWITAAGAWTRPDDFEAGTNAAASIVIVQKGTSNADTQWLCTTDAGSDLVDTDSLVFVDVTGLALITAGTGMTKTANTLNVIGGDGLTANANDMALDLKTNGGISIDTAQAKLDINDLTAAVVDVAADSIAISDANDSDASRKESIVDFAAGIAGAGLTAALGVIIPNINGLPAASVVVANDSIAFADAADSNLTKKESVADFIALVAGAGLNATAGVLIPDLNGVAAAVVDPTADSIAIIDAGDSNLTKKESVDDFLTLTSDESTLEVNASKRRVKDAGVTPVKLSGGFIVPGADVAVSLAATDRFYHLNSTTGTKAFTVNATHAGHMIVVHVVTLSGGSYTIAVTGGTITLDAVREGAIIVYSGTAWELFALTGGSTFA